MNNNKKSCYEKILNPLIDNNYENNLWFFNLMLKIDYGIDPYVRLVVTRHINKYNTLTLKYNFYNNKHLMNILNFINKQVQGFIENPKLSLIDITHTNLIKNLYEIQRFYPDFTLMDFIANNPEKKNLLIEAINKTIDEKLKDQFFKLVLIKTSKFKNELCLIVNNQYITILQLYFTQFISDEELIEMINKRIEETIKILKQFLTIIEQKNI